MNKEYAFQVMDKSKESPIKFYIRINNTKAFLEASYKDQNISFILSLHHFLNLWDAIKNTNFKATV